MSGSAFQRAQQRFAALEQEAQSGSGSSGSNSGGIQRSRSAEGVAVGGSSGSSSGGGGVPATWTSFDTAPTTTAAAAEDPFSDINKTTTTTTTTNATAMTGRGQLLQVPSVSQQRRTPSTSTTATTATTEDPFGDAAAVISNYNNNNEEDDDLLPGTMSASDLPLLPRHSHSHSQSHSQSLLSHSHAQPPPKPLRRNLTSTSAASNDNNNNNNNNNVNPFDDPPAKTRSGISTTTTMTTTMTTPSVDSPAKPALPPRPSPGLIASPSQPSSVDKPPLPARPKLPVSMLSTENILRNARSSAVTDKATVFPDATDAHRKTPLATFHSSDHHDVLLPIKSPPVKCIAIAKSFLCIASSTAGLRIHNLVSGDVLSPLQPKGEVRITSLCFVPAAILEQDGKYLWCGSSDGDLCMLNVNTGDILERRQSAHSHPVSFILPFRRHLWSLDDNGVLQLWTDINPNNVALDYMVSLDSRPKTLRIGVKQTCAVVVGRDLWTGKDKTIEVVSPYDETSSFKKRIEVPAIVGAITTLAFIEKTGCVYSGHMDGKVIEWETETFTKRQIMEMGSYRISSLLGVNGWQLWIGFGTGRILVLDVSDEHAAVVMKDIAAATNESIECLAHDPDSALSVGQIVVASASKNGVVNVYDALFPQEALGTCHTQLPLHHDLVEFEMKRREAEYCYYQNISLFIGSWNIDATKPELLEYRTEDSYFMNNWVKTVPDGADVYVFGFQEIIDLESKKIAAKGIFKNATKKAESSTSLQTQHDHASRANSWKDRIARALRENFRYSYEMVDCRNMVGLLSCIFVKQDLIQNGTVSNVSSMTVSTGLGGTYGNKGAIVSRFLLNDSSFCFIVSHLPAHQDKVGKRNVDAITIIRSGGLPAVEAGDATVNAFIHGGDGTQVLDHENCFFFGDLNYRIDIDRDRVEQLIEQEDWPSLWAGDQLIRQRQQVNTTCLLRIFDEGVLNFAPTYKYDPNTSVYDTSEKRRTPAWCDRILYRDGLYRQLNSSLYSSFTGYKVPTPTVSSLAPLTDPNDPMGNASVPPYSTTSAAQSPTRRRSDTPMTFPRIVQRTYDRFECKVSDHRPIGSAFTVTIKKINSLRFQTTQDDVLRLVSQHFQHQHSRAGAQWVLRRSTVCDERQEKNVEELLQTLDINSAMRSVLEWESKGVQ